MPKIPTDYTCRVLGMLVALFAACLAAVPASAAKQPAYVGTWGTSAEQCAAPQDTVEAPMIIGAKGYDQHETHCTFSKIKRKGATWRMLATCSVEGDQQKMFLTMTAKGKSLVFQWDGTEGDRFSRCK